MTHPLWERAVLAASLMASPGIRTGGLWLRARSGEVQRRYLNQLNGLFPDMRRIGPGTDDMALAGALDVTRSLTEGRRVEGRGILSSFAPILLTSAERCTPHRAARLAHWIDAGGLLILLDEGTEDDDAPAPSLTDRLPFFADLDTLRLDECDTVPAAPPPGSAVCNDAQLVTLTQVAAGLGISDLRAPLATACAAAAHAGLHGRAEPVTADMEAAVALVLAHRAMSLPNAADSAPEDQKQDEDRDDSAQSSQPIDLTEDRLIAAAETALPPEVLAEIAKRRRAKNGTGSGAGALALSTERGRPLPPRKGRPGARTRVDLIATLRTAAPWQRLRGAERGRVAVRAGDIHLKRHAERSERLVIFVVDASGSAAMARLAEAKGAVSILLGEAYRSRDSVSLIAFRGEKADVMLPPTKALVAAKNRLAALPGGGATPLADALRHATDMAAKARRAGTDVVVVLMTDGRANRTLAGEIDRAQAQDDAMAMASLLAMTGTECLVLDTGNRRSAALNALSQRLMADCLPLPRGGAREVAALASAGRR